jgi:hypothetical protein
VTTTAERVLRWDAASKTLRIIDGRTDERYVVEAIRHEGRLLGYRLRKESDGERYDIDLAAGTCDCRGHTRWGYCKHDAGIRKLIDRGDLQGG